VGGVWVVGLGRRLVGVDISLRRSVNNDPAAANSAFGNDIVISVSLNCNEVDASTHDAVFAGEVLHEIELERPVSDVFVCCTIGFSGETVESTSGGILVHGWVAFHVLFFEWVEFGIIRIVTVPVGADLEFKLR